MIIDLEAIVARAALGPGGWPILPDSNGTGHLLAPSGTVLTVDAAHFLRLSQDITTLVAEVRRLRELVVSPFTVQPEQAHGGQCRFCFHFVGERHGRCCEIAGDELPAEVRYSTYYEREGPHAP